MRMKSIFAIGFALPVVLAVSMMGCARDRAGCSSCSGATNAFSQNSQAYSSKSNARAGSNSSSPDINAVQHKLCPVTGEPLDSMGGAIPVDANGQTIFVCCQGCVKSVKNDPAKYLAIARSE